MLYTYHDKRPRIPESVFIAPGAVIIGDVEIGEDTSIWFNCVVRGDVNWIRIGSATNIQDGSVLHVTSRDAPLQIGDNVTVGHAAILHGCTVQDYCLIGMGATILDGAKIGAYSLVAAGSLVREGETIPNHSLVAGVPAIVKRTLDDNEIAILRRSAERYVQYKNAYLDGAFEPLPESATVVSSSPAS